MISVIVPVYKVEDCLEDCLNSIISQTYRSLEILLIDNGSPDRCGEICDRYAATDSRIRVFHTENTGLASARNFGIEKASGDYLGFVDSDDRIEPDMYERLLEAIEKAGADIAVCGRVMEYPDKTEIISPPAGVMTGEEAVKALALLRIRNPAWDKLWKRECFEDIRFPDGRVYEDIATTYRVFLRTGTVVCLPDALYHYRIRESGISRDDSPGNLSDYFTATRSEFEELMSVSPFCEDEEIRQALFRRCVSVYAKFRMKYNACKREERVRYKKEISSADRFMRDNFRLLISSDCPAGRKLTVFLCCFASPLMPALTPVYLKLKPIFKPIKQND